MENLPCIFSPRSRNSEDTCYGKVEKVCGVEARSCGFSEAIVVCFGHLKRKKLEDQKNCSYPLATQTPCCATLVQCPHRLYAAFDSLKSLKIGNYICFRHLHEADENPQITSLTDYCPPNTRKVRNTDKCKPELQNQYRT